MRGNRTRDPAGGWDREQMLQGLTETGRAQRRADVGWRASRAAADPVTGPYLCGELASFLDGIGQLHNLSSIVTAAEEYGERARALQHPDAQPAPAGAERADVTADPGPATAAADYEAI